MSDIWFLILLLIINLLLLGFALKFNRKVGGINAIILLFYSIPLYYNLIYNSSGGIGLLWWCCLLILHTFHCFVLLAYIIIKWIKRK